MVRGLNGSASKDLQTLYRLGTVAGTTDAELLGRFATRRDERAFAALVARHGPMVLSICRGLLHDPNDAEDAFQATFLILARQAHAVWVESSLAGWLYRVSSRVARQANVAAERRRRHEQHAAGLAQRVSAPSMSDDAGSVAEAAEARRLVFDEIERLPNPLRLPVVLFYLEGRSYASVAHALGMTETAIRGRLERARRRLRDRLSRRGLAPGEAAGLLSVMRVPPAVPDAWAGLAVRSAAAGWAVAGRPAGVETGATARALAKAAAHRPATALSAALGIPTVLATAYLAVAAPTPRDEDRPEPPQASRPRPTDGDAGPPPPAPGERPGRAITLAGRVLDGDGRPLRDATLTLCYTPRRGENRKPGGDWKDQFEPLGRTGADGRFRLDVDLVRLAAAAEPGNARKFTFLYATADGYGPVCVYVPMFPDPDLRWRFVHQPIDAIEFRLPRDDVPIVGLIQDADGRPVSGVLVQPTALSYYLNPDGSPRTLESGNPDPPNRDRGRGVDVQGLFPPAVTDAEGRFRLTGFGRERLVVLELTAPGRRPIWIEVATVREASRRLVLDDGFAGDAVYMTSEFKHTLRAAPKAAEPGPGDQ